MVCKGQPLLSCERSGNMPFAVFLRSGIAYHVTCISVSKFSRFLHSLPTRSFILVFTVCEYPRNRDGHCAISMKLSITISNIHSSRYTSI